jgi:hydrogenase maturation protease
VKGSWDELSRAAPEAVVVGGVEVRRGSRVRLRPKASADVWDLALAGRSATVEGIEQDTADQLLLTVAIDDDPGRNLRHPGHRFFFTPEEVEPLPRTRVLVAGIGNVFLGDDGFGVALAERLTQRELPAGVDVADFGIRGMDLAYALAGYDAVVLLDATPRGAAPGTLYVIEPDVDLVEPGLDAHGMDPVKVLGLARALGDAALPRTLVVGCEPLTRMTGEEPDVVAELSDPVRAALEEAARLVGGLLEELQQEGEPS